MMKKSDLFSGPTLEIVNKFEEKLGPEKKPEYWEYDAVTPARRKAKSYFIKTQLRKCCYCKQKISSKNFKLWDVEHILPRYSNPAFMFEPNNLAVACPDCNTSKSSKIISKSKTYKHFPKQSKSYTITHPHFDIYEDNIHQVGYVYISKSKKGTQTITVCNLHRYAENYIDWENPAAVEEINTNIAKIGADKEKIRKLLLYAASI